MPLLDIITCPVCHRSASLAQQHQPTKSYFWGIRKLFLIDAYCQSCCIRFSSSRQLSFFQNAFSAQADLTNIQSVRLPTDKEAALTSLTLPPKLISKESQDPFLLEFKSTALGIEFRFQLAIGRFLTTLIRRSKCYFRANSNIMPEWQNHEIRAELVNRRRRG